ncbi:cyclic peptide export ABC transporter [Allocoleopsis franciscana]|uniref:Cyclic peptide transporter n=1 Tax=Allocoleopsis franciscana PCC 7113 TaxID=1173027 RepID=K9WP54_9CYAN|nr:cyclic peptide export ABC transporter [Allocoleopsis franciscana]AFZ21554.1 cyclic peptide transporter [Allocoleopsis franciscana PCC 7113]
MNLIYFLLRSSWRMVAIAIVTGFLSGGSSAGLIALIGYAMGSGVASASRAIAWGFAGLALVALLTSILARVVLIHLSQNAIFQLQMRLSRQILATELSHLEKLGFPRLLATLTEDVQAISNAVYVIPFLCINVAIVAGSLVYITWLSWKVFLIVVVLSVIALGSCRVLLKRGRQLIALAREEQDQLFNHFRTITEGVKELKLNYQRRQDFLTQDLQVTATNFRRHNTEGLTLFATTDSWGKLIFFFAIGLVLFVLPNLIVIDLQTLAGYVLTFTYLIGPMDNIVNKLPLISKANVALQKIETLGFSLTSCHEVAMIPPEFKSSWQSLEFKGVTHTYQREQEDINFTVGPINLTLRPGELLFIIGGNGSGKSTLAKLITGLYIPETGEIRLDGQLINQQNREWYRQHFSVVFSDFYLFDRLVGFNPADVDLQAQDYLKQLQLDRKVKVEQGKLSTTALSQGQQKRLALLTAYLEDRPIYLFDEWAADQDPLFKEIFYTQFLPQLRDKGKTVLVISHDDHYFYLADRMIKLDYGMVEFDKRSHP